jgi:hypothetical protein
MGFVPRWFGCAQRASTRERTSVTTIGKITSRVRTSTTVPWSSNHSPCRSSRRAFHRRRTALKCPTQRKLGRAGGDRRCYVVHSLRSVSSTCLGRDQLSIEFSPFTRRRIKVRQPIDGCGANCNCIESVRPTSLHDERLGPANRQERAHVELFDPTPLGLA